MPATATAPAPNFVFLNNEEIYEEFTHPSQIMVYQSEVYNYKDFKVTGDADIHLYRCDKEMHNLKIYMKNGVPYHVEGSYSVEPIKL